MTFLPYMVFATLTLLLALCAGVIWMLGADAFMWRGVSAGAAAGLALMAFGWFTTLKGVSQRDKRNALGHMIGGFLLRLTVLTVGFGALALTEWGNPAGFVLAFFMVVLLYLALQILAALRKLKAETGQALTPTEA